MKRYNPSVKYEHHGGFLQALPSMTEDKEGQYVEWASYEQLLNELSRLENQDF